MAKDNNLTDLLTAIANAIRAKKGTQAAINPQNFDTEIASIPLSEAEDVSTEVAMNAKCVSSNKNKIFRYTGPTTSNYVSGCYYLVKCGSYTIESVSGYQYNFVQDTEVVYPQGTTYKSTNWEKNSSRAVVKVTFRDCMNPTVYINSWAENGYDYAIATVLDATEVPTSATAASVLISTINKNQNPRNGLNDTNWSSCTYALNGQEHYIYIIYRKDGTSSKNDDLGRFIIDDATAVSPYFALINITNDTLVITDASEHDVVSYKKAQAVDANLVAGNIKKDVSILGVTGTFEGGGGGETGHKVYFGFAGGGDDGYLQLNGEDAQRITNYMSGLGPVKNTNIPSSGIRTIKMWGFDHPGTSESTSSSFARWRVHGSSAWTYIQITRDEASATLLTLTSDIDLDIAEYTCLERNTLISMADGTKKKVKDIESGDLVKGYGGQTYIVYQDENGAFAYTEDRDVWTFENGYEVITCHRHRFYNYEHQAFMYLQDWAIGEHAITEDGTRVALIGHEHQDEICHYASLWCNKSGIKDTSDDWKDGNNYYAGGLLAGNRYSEHIAVI